METVPNDFYIFRVQLAVSASSVKCEGEKLWIHRMMKEEVRGSCPRMSKFQRMWPCVFFLEGPPKTKIVIEQLNIPSKTLVSILAIREGAKRFAFMLETCKPGTAPDAPLLGALLDLVRDRIHILFLSEPRIFLRTPPSWPEP